METSIEVRPRMSAQDTFWTHNVSPLLAGFDLAGRLKLGSQCVNRDAYDEAAFSSLLDENPALRECSRRGEVRLRSFPDLLSDIFCLLFKLRPALVDRNLVRPAFKVNRYLIARLAGEPHVKNARARTALDEEAAGAATIAVAGRLLDELAANNLADENLLFELGEASGENGTKKGPAAPVHRRSAASRKAEGGEGDGPGCKPLPYDLQQRLEMAEALEGLRNFERLLALTDALVSRLANDDPTRWQATEVYDIGLGNEIARLLPGELLALRAPLRKKDFLRRLLGRQLLTYQIKGREFSGPMVILVDVSDSMAGEKELASKALAIALSQVAADRGQPVSAILFGPRTAPLWRIDFQRRRPQRRQIMELAETFFGGGTDFERPISAAIELIAKKREGEGQVIFISDGLCEVGEEWLSRILAAKARRQVQILTVIVDIEPWSAKAAATFSDQTVRYGDLAAC